MQAIDLNLLPATRVLIEEQSVTRAAHRLHLSVPATSRLLARARVAFGDPLLVSHGRGLARTPGAEALLPGLRAALDAVDDVLVRDEAPFDPAAWRATVTVRSPDALLTVLGAQLTDTLLAQAPGLTLCFETETADDLPDLRDGRVWLAIGSYEETTGFERRHLRDERIVGALRAGHPRAGRRISLTAFARLPHLDVSRRGRRSAAVDRAIAAHGFTREVRAIVPSSTTAATMLAGSELTAVLPEHLATHLGLATYRLPFPAPPVPVALLWHRRFSADPAHRWLRDRLAEAITAPR